MRTVASTVTGGERECKEEAVVTAAAPVAEEIRRRMGDKLNYPLSRGRSAITKGQARYTGCVRRCLKKGSRSAGLSRRTEPAQRPSNRFTMTRNPEYLSFDSDPESRSRRRGIFREEKNAAHEFGGHGSRRSRDVP